LTDDHVAEHDFLFVVPVWYPSTNTHYQRQLGIGKAYAQGSRNSSSADNSHTGHMSQHYIVFAYNTSRVDIGIPNGFPVFAAIIFPELIKHSLQAVGFQGEGTDQRNLEVVPITRGSDRHRAAMLST